MPKSTESDEQAADRDAQCEAAYQSCIEDRDTYSVKPDRWSFNKGYERGRAEVEQRWSVERFAAKVPKWARDAVQQAQRERTAEIVAWLRTRTITDRPLRLYPSTIAGLIEAKYRDG